MPPAATLPIPPCMAAAAEPFLSVSTRCLYRLDLENVPAATPFAVNPIAPSMGAATRIGAASTPALITSAVAPTGFADA